MTHADRQIKIVSRAPGSLRQRWSSSGDDFDPWRFHEFFTCWLSYYIKPMSDFRFRFWRVFSLLLCSLKSLTECELNIWSVFSSPQQIAKAFSSPNMNLISSVKSVKRSSNRLAWICQSISRLLIHNWGQVSDLSWAKSHKNGPLIVQSSEFELLRFCIQRQIRAFHTSASVLSALRS